MHLISYSLRLPLPGDCGRYAVYDESTTMSRIALFTDVSINTNLKIGFGAYLMIPESYLRENSSDLIKKEVKLKKFESTSSTKLEIETLLWALVELEKSHKEKDLYCNVTIYTDSQCIAGLSGRRTKLERSEFKSSKTNKELNNALLYRRFYRFSDRLKFEIIKLRGHSQSIIKDKIHKMFQRIEKSFKGLFR
jgi:ribonuclease HI